MINSSLAKAVILALSAGALGGTGYAIHHFSRDSFESKLGISVLNLTGDDNSTMWSKRWASLKKKSTGLDAALIAAKDTKWQDLQNWCRNKKDTKFSNKNDNVYQNFESFCTWKVGDKLSGQIAESTIDTDTKWGTAHAKLKQKKKEELTPKLQKVWESKDAENANKKAMYGWCIQAYETTWTGNTDKMLADANEFCKDS